MKYLSLWGVMFAGAVWCAPVRAAEPASVRVASREAYALTEHLRYNEGTVAVRSGVLVSNFGCETFDPLNQEGKGYIVSLTKEGPQVLIPADGNLHAPKGMAVENDRLYIADVGCVVVYNLKRPAEAPVRIAFPEGEVYVNDVISLKGFILASVTNTGNIYLVDTRRPDQLHEIFAQRVANVPGANGLAEHQGTIYVASYDPGEQPGPENVIYAFDLTAPEHPPVNLTGERYGQYDGLAVSPDGKRLYFSNWKSLEGRPEVGYIELESGEYNITLLDFEAELEGPADICLSDGFLYVPDLPASKLYIIEVE